MYRLLRRIWGLVAVGGSVAVGIITRDPGFTALTFVGGLIAPRALGLTPRMGPFGRAAALFGGGPGFAGPGWRRGCGMAGRGGWQGQRFDEWHRQSHEGQPTAPPAQTA